VNANEATPDSSGDVIVDFGDGFAVAVLIADCLPILLVDETHRRSRSCTPVGRTGEQRDREALAHFEHHDAVHAFWVRQSPAPPIRSSGRGRALRQVPGALAPDAVIVPGSICAPSPSPILALESPRPPHAREPSDRCGARLQRPCDATVRKVRAGRAPGHRVKQRAELFRYVGLDVTSDTLTGFYELDGRASLRRSRSRE